VGVARGEKSSLVATVCFMAAAAAVANLATWALR
jgi:hypothetical protein